ncbi:GNAT family N-acetyltransferase [Neptunicella sp. SCSIO 80796]|uniref:GNAT family N-acetyltransferase n=1 Tax=Neptunicella plasticusilytica TaxID=3117012 RepID=UPI003A4E2AC6
MDIKIEVADYANPLHQKDMTYLLDIYARDPMGGGAPLSAYTQENLANELAKIANAFSILCYVDHQPAGIANCFQGFSTFKCKPLVNIHDLAVASQYRGLGLSQKILFEIEKIARQRGCCKITLEVLEGNKTAQAAYLKFGFGGYQLNPDMGKALFWEKPL